MNVLDCTYILRVLLHIVEVWDGEAYSTMCRDPVESTQTQVLLSAMCELFKFFK